MADMTATTMATWLPEVWSKRATVTYRSNTVLANLMDRSWEPELGVKKGDTINIPSFSQNSGATLRSTFGTAASITFTATTESQVQLAVNKMAYYAYRIPVEDAVQAMAEYEVKLTDGIGTAIALKIDNEIASDNTNGIDGFSTVGTDNEDITEPNIITCRVNLDNNNARFNDRYLVVSPASLGSIIQVDYLRNQLYAGSTGAIDANKGQGRVGKIHGFDVYESNNLEAGSSGKKNGAFQREAIALCVQQEVKILRAPNIADGGFEEVMGFAVFGHKMVNSNWGNELDGK